jgi:hypothetical protein
MRRESTRPARSFRLAVVRLACSALVSLVLVAVAGASSAWRVRVSEGIAGVRLGMTEADVVARIGKPYATSLPSGNATCGMYARIPAFGACFHMRTRRVVTLYAIGPKFCVVRPRFCFQRVGGLAKLKRAFGRRLIGPVRKGDQVFYKYIVRRGSRRVQSAFVVDTQSPPPYRDSAVAAAYIAFCGRQGSIVPRCAKRR